MVVVGKPPHDRRSRPREIGRVGAVERGVQYLINYPQRSWALFIRGREKELDSELFRRAWRDTLPRFALRPAALDTARYANFAAFLKSQGIIPKVLPVADYARELK